MNGNGSWEAVLVDAALAGGAAIVALLMGMTFAGVAADPRGIAFTALVAFFGAFIFSLQAARGRPSPNLHPIRQRAKSRGR